MEDYSGTGGRSVTTSIKKKLRGDAIHRVSQEGREEKGMRGRVALLCRSLGYSKQAYYRSQRSGSRQERDCYLAELVEELREYMPRLGGLKLWKSLNDNDVRVGRDELYELLRRRGLLVKRSQKRVVTTDS